MAAEDKMTQREVEGQSPDQAGLPDGQPQRAQPQAGSLGRDAGDGSQEHHRAYPLQPAAKASQA